jgi:hypothetical protein
MGYYMEFVRGISILAVSVGALPVLAGCGPAGSEDGYTGPEDPAPVDEISQAVVPAVPTLISPSGDVNCKLNFRWNRVPGATHYQLHVKDSVANPRLSQVFTANEVHCPLASHPVCDITPTQAFAVGPGTWRLSAGNADGFSAYASRNFTILTPGQATNIFPLSTAPTNPVFRWSAVASTEVYRLVVEDVLTGTRVIDTSPSAAAAGCAAGPPATCTLQPGTLVADRTYTWTVLTWNSANFIGCWSLESSFEVQATGLAAPAQIAPDGDAANFVTFSWYAVAAATRYRLLVHDGDTLNEIDQIYTSTAAGCGGGSGICSITTGETLSPGTGRWFVQALDATNAGPFSPGLNFTIGMVGQPTAISPSGVVVPTNRPTFTWSPAANATRYLLWVSDVTKNGKVRMYIDATAAGCAGGVGTCSATITTPLASGPATWTVQGNGGPWSTPKAPFTVP